MYLKRGIASVVVGCTLLLMAAEPLVAQSPADARSVRREGVRACDSSNPPCRCLLYFHDEPGTKPTVGEHDEAGLSLTPLSERERLRITNLFHSLLNTHNGRYSYQVRTPQKVVVIEPDTEVDLMKSSSRGRTRYCNFEGNARAVNITIVTFTHMPGRSYLNQDEQLSVRCQQMPAEQYADLVRFALGVYHTDLTVFPKKRELWRGGICSHDDELGGTRT